MVPEQACPRQPEDGKERKEEEDGKERIWSSGWKRCFNWTVVACNSTQSTRALCLSASQAAANTSPGGQVDRMSPVGRDRVSFPIAGRRRGVSSQPDTQLDAMPNLQNGIKSRMSSRSDV